MSIVKNILFFLQISFCFPYYKKAPLINTFLYDILLSFKQFQQKIFEAMFTFMIEIVNFLSFLIIIQKPGKVHALPGISSIFVNI